MAGKRHRDESCCVTMNYVCPECAKPVGLMVDGAGHPQPFRCVHTRRGAEPQVPMRRSTPKLPEPSDAVA